MRKIVVFFQNPWGSYVKNKSSPSDDFESDLWYEEGGFDIF